MLVIVSKEASFKLDHSMFSVEGSYEDGYIYNREVFFLEGIGYEDWCEVEECTSIIPYLPDYIKAFFNMVDFFGPREVSCEDATIVVVGDLCMKALLIIVHDYSPGFNDVLLDAVHSEMWDDVAQYHYQVTGMTGAEAAHLWAHQERRIARHGLYKG